MAKWLYGAPSFNPNVGLKFKHKNVCLKCKKTEYKMKQKENYFCQYCRKDTRIEETEEEE